MDHRHHVVIVGAGFGGLAAARALAEAPVDVTLIDANNFHTFQPLLYQVATAGLDADDIAHPVRGIFHRREHVAFRLGRVERVDLDRRVVHVDQGAALPYDSLVVAAGAVTNTYGIPGVAEHALAMKSLTDAVALRAHVLRQFERADSDPDVVDRGGLTFVVGGGGPTGVELAGGLAELFTKVLRRDFPRLDVGRARIVLVEPTDRLLGAFHPRLSAHAASSLRRRRVEVELGVGVQEADASSVLLSDGRRIPTATLVWTAGVRAHPIADGLGAQTRGGRVVVEADLSLPGHPEVFVVGDLAASPSNHSRPAGAPPGGWGPLAQVAPVAIQGGAHAARQIRARLEGRATTAFRYRDKGSMATIGRNDAVADLPGGVRLTGPVGWLAWLGLHLVMLIGFRNRANVLLNWSWNYLTYDRGARLIVDGP